MCRDNLCRLHDLLAKRYEVDFHYVFNEHKHSNAGKAISQAQLHSFDCWTERCAELLYQSRQYSDPHNDEYLSIKNLTQQFEMLDYARTLSSIYNPDYILYLRDDILVRPSRLVSAVERSITQNKVWFSAFHGNNGYCERFGVLPVEHSRIMNRFDFVDRYFAKINELDYVLRKGLNGEWLFRYIIDSEVQGFLCSYVLSRRVRNEKQIVNERMIPRPWHYKSEAKIFSGIVRYYTGD